MTLIVNDGTPEMRGLLEKGRKRLRTVGVVMLILGVLAVAFPLATTIAFKSVIGWLFLKEPMTAVKAVLLLMIIGGVVGLKTISTES